MTCPLWRPIAHTGWCKTFFVTYNSFVKWIPFLRLVSTTYSPGSAVVPGQLACNSERASFPPLYDHIDQKILTSFLITSLVSDNKSMSLETPCGLTRISCCTGPARMELRAVMVLMAGQRTRNSYSCMGEEKYIIELATLMVTTNCLCVRSYDAETHPKDRQTKDFNKGNILKLVVTIFIWPLNQLRPLKTDKSRWKELVWTLWGS